MYKSSTSPLRPTENYLIPPVAEQAGGERKMEVFLDTMSWPTGTEAQLNHMNDALTQQVSSSPDVVKRIKLEASSHIRPNNANWFHHTHLNREKRFKRLEGISLRQQGKKGLPQRSAPYLSMPWSNPRLRLLVACTSCEFKRSSATSFRMPFLLTR